MTWSQNYTPLADSIGLSALVAALPVVTLLALLAFWHVRAHLAALAGLLVAAAIAIGVYGMPVTLTLASAGYGAAFGLFPIGWIVLNAIFIYNLSVETGGFKVLQDRMSNLSDDRRIQALMIGFSFGAFIEGFAGFGAPVAITGALMIGLGFRPLEAAKIALIGNTAPVAFGSVGIPVITLAKVTGLDEGALSAMVGRQLPFFALLVPFWLVAAQAGWRGMVGVWPACLVAGASFAGVQFLVSNFHGPYLVDAAAGLSSIGALVILLRFWKPREAQTHPGQVEAAPDPNAHATMSRSRENLRAWLPWILLTVFVAGSSLAPVKNALNQTFAPKLSVPALHQAVQKMPPVVAKPEPEAAQFTFNLLRYRHCAARSWRHRRLRARAEAPPTRGHLRSHTAPGPRAAADHRLDAGPRFHHALQRHRHHDGVGVCLDRRALSFLFPAAGLAGCGADRERYFLQRAVREFAESHRPTA